MLQAELRRISGVSGRPMPGGVELELNFEAMMRLQLRSGLATSFRQRIARFSAQHLSELARRSRAIDWQAVLPKGARVRVQASCKKSRIYHSKAAEARLLDALDAQLQLGSGSASGSGSTSGPGLEKRASRDAALDSAELAPSASEFRLYLRIHKDQAEISLDLTGEPLYRRGYRRATGKAPLRSDLAFALLRLAEYSPELPLWDPFCGSGTIPIEAAMLSQKLAPNLGRDFAFMALPRFEASRFQAIRTELWEARRPQIAPILASDRDAGVIEGAKDNACRAQVLEGIEFEEAALSAASWASRPPGDAGLVVSHPPYGKRTSDRGNRASRGDRGLVRVYQKLGELRRRWPPGWRLALIGASRELMFQTGQTFDSLLTTSHSGTQVSVLVEPFSASLAPKENDGNGTSYKRQL